VLWVITSRDSLDWDSVSLKGLLAATGPQVWPGLSLGTSTEPRQHRVGDLSDTDVDRYLAAASGVSGNPQLGPEVVARIRAGAHGLPLYLDLSMAIARTGVDSNGELDPAAFGGPLPELVTHVFADLLEGERDVARMASLLPRFSPEVVARAAGRLVGDAYRFCSRALVTKDEHATFPYRLHDAVRAAILDEPGTAAGAWAPADRRDRATELLETLHRVHDEVVDVDRRRDVLELASGLCATDDLEAAWLLEALLDLSGMSLTAGRLPAPDPSTWIGQISMFFESYRDRTASERIDYLERLRTEPLRPDVATKVDQFLAYALRGRDGVNEADRLRALSILREQLEEQPDSAMLRYQVARTLHGLEDFEQLAEHTQKYPLTEPSAEGRIDSDLAYQRGHVAQSITGAAERAAHLRSVGRFRVALENQVVVAWRGALTGTATVAECEETASEADRVGMHSVMRTALAAKCVCQLGIDDALPAFLSEVETLIKARGGKHGWREWAASLIHALYRDDQQAVHHIREQWTADPPRPSYSYRMVDRLFVYAGYPPTFAPPWLGANGAAVDSFQLWHEVIDQLVNPT
jgi:hypothetical protein